jgi:exopolysaccharide biosynthesis polyprenyl glycosylphosphotransferase
MRSAGYFAIKGLVFADLVALAACLAATWKSPNTAHIREYLLVLLIVPVWSFFFRYFGLYESHRVGGLLEMIRPVVAAQFLGLILVAHTLFFMGLLSKLETIIQFALLSSAIILIPRLTLLFTLRQLRKRGFDRRRVCVVGNWADATRMQTDFDLHPVWGLEVVSVAEGKPAARRFVSFPGGKSLASNVEEFLHQQVIDEVLMVVPGGSLADETETIAACERFGIVGRVMLTQQASISKAPRVETFLGEASLAVGRLGPPETSLALKRMIDIVLASILLVLTAPLFLFIAALIKLSSPGSVLFRQTRIGLHGREFTIYKFRTMVRDADALLPEYAKRNLMGYAPFKDPQDFRITPLGRWLRRASLDELPQLLNVLVGSMSLVGPRPLPVHEASTIGGEFRRRFSMKPGITCLWQVSGRNTIPFVQWMQYDVQYVDHWSIWLDAQLLIKTIPAVISGKGAY